VIIFSLYQEERCLGTKLRAAGQRRAVPLMRETSHWQILRLLSNLN